MTSGSLRFLLGAGATLTGALVIAASQAQTRSCPPPQAVREGWSTSFVAGCFDRNGKFAGGGSGAARCLSLAPYVAGMGPTGRPRRPSVLVLPTLHHYPIGSLEGAA